MMLRKPCKWYIFGGNAHREGILLIFCSCILFHLQALCCFEIPGLACCGLRSSGSCWLCSCSSIWLCFCWKCYGICALVGNAYPVTTGRLCQYLFSHVHWRVGWTRWYFSFDEILYIYMIQCKLRVKFESHFREKILADWFFATEKSDIPFPMQNCL